MGTKQSVPRKNRINSVQQPQFFRQLESHVQIKSDESPLLTQYDKKGNRLNQVKQTNVSDFDVTKWYQNCLNSNSVKHQNSTGSVKSQNSSPRINSHSTPVFQDKITSLVSARTNMSTPFLQHNINEDNEDNFSSKASSKHNTPLSKVKPVNKNINNAEKEQCFVNMKDQKRLMEVAGERLGDLRQLSETLDHFDKAFVLFPQEYSNAMDFLLDFDMIMDSSVKRQTEFLKMVQENSDVIKSLIPRLHRHLGRMQTLTTSMHRMEERMSTFSRAVYQITHCPKPKDTNTLTIKSKMKT